MKKSLSIILSILMIVAMLPMNVLTASATEEEIDGVIYCDLSHRADFDIIKMTLRYADGNNGDVKTIVMERDTPDIWKADVSPNGMVMFEGYTSDGNFVSIVGERKQGTNCLRVTEYNSSSKMFEGVWYQYPCTSHNYEDGICACGEICFHSNYLDGICGTCGYECPHEWNDGVLTRPTFETDGYYTYTCTLCGHSYTEPAKRADDTALKDTCVKVTQYYSNDTLTQEAIDEIKKSYRDILRNNDNIFDELGFVRNDLIEEDQPLIDAITAELEKIIADADEKIASGEYVKINGLEEIAKINDKIKEELTEKYGEEALTEIIDKIGCKYDEKFDDIQEKAEALTGSVAENKEALEKIEAEIEAIFAEIEKCLAGIHSFTDYEIVRDADCVNNAWENGTCSVCGETDEREIPDSAYGHNPAGWWGKTETEHYKHCTNDSCSDEIEGTRGQHVYENYEITKAAACGVNAEETGTCICGMTHTREAEGTALIHSFTKYEEIEKSECGKAGKEVAYCDHGCGATDEKEIPALTHKDEDGDFFCDYGCGHEFEKPADPDLPEEPEEPEDPSDKCDHLCHRTGFMGFIWKIINFFFKLFNIQQYCDCGKLHY